MKQTALITGASAGIGAELAKCFAKGGYDLVLTARRTEALNRLAGEIEKAYGAKSAIFSADLTEPQSPEQILAFTQQQGTHVDVLVNNAGFGANGRFAELDTKTQMDMLQVNINSLVHLTRLYLPSMLERKQGGVLNVASTAAFIPGPLMAVYYATKAFVLSFSEALANEIEGSGVKLSCLCPGATITEFQIRANLEKGALFRTPFVMDAATVARMGYDGFEKNKAVVVCGLPNAFSVFLSRFLPRSVGATMARKLQEV